MESIVNSYNLFLDTEMPPPGSNFANFNLDLTEQPIVASPGEHVRLSLSNFSMFKPTFDLRSNEEYFLILYDYDISGNTIASGFFVPKILKYTLPASQINNISTLATILANSIQTGLNTDLSNLQMEFTFSSLTVTPTINQNDTFSLKLNIAGYTPYVNTHRFAIQVIPKTYELLRMLGLPETNQDTIDYLENNISPLPYPGTPIEIDRLDGFLTDAELLALYGTGAMDETNIVYNGSFTMQRAASSYLYLRTSLASTAIESAILGFNATDNHKAIPSDILAKIPINDIISYDSQNGEYFINCKQKFISGIRFRLTDHRGRLINVKPYNAVIRVDILKDRTPALLETTPTPNPVPSRFSNLLQKQDHGRDGFGKPPGF